MAKALFKSYDQGKVLLFPTSFEDEISQNSPVRPISQIVDKLDISSVLDTYSREGTTSCHPRMLLKVIFYAYMNNIYSCRKIFKQLQENIHYMWLSGNQTPDFRTVNNFRSLHLKDTVHDLFTQVVLLLVEMEHLSICYFNEMLLKAENKTVYCSSDIIESCFGKHKELIKNNKSVGISDLCVCIAAMMGNNDLNDTKMAMESKKNKNIMEWRTKNIPVTLFAQKRELLKKCGGTYLL